MLDHEIIGKFKEFQEKTGKYSDLKIEDVEFERVRLKNIADFPSLTRVSGGVDLSIEEYKNLSENDKKKYIPLISGTVENNQISGYINRNRVSKKSLSGKNVISWTRINIEKFFIQSESVCTNDDSFVMKVNSNHDIKYVQLSTMTTIKYSKKFSWTNKAGKNKIKEVEIPIPKDLNEKYTSYKLQEVIVEFLEWGFAEADKIKENIDDRANILKRAKNCLIPSVFKKDYVKRTFGKYAKENGLYYNITDVEFEEKQIEEIANSISSSSGYNKNYYKNNQGKYPLYTGSLDVVAYVDPISEDDIINIESVSYNKDNDAGSKAFYHNKPYIMGGHHYAFVANNEYKDKISMKYFYFCLNDIFAKNRFYQSKQPVANIGSIKQFFIKIPKPLNNYTSLEIQKHIANFIDHYMNIIEKQEKQNAKINEATEKLKTLFLCKTFRNIKEGE